MASHTLPSVEHRSLPNARAEAALTHPATLVALATLLVNDLVFKWLWPGSWVTGKLSDLAWVIFASPLLALPLTFLARRNRNAQKAAWTTAYIGLPLLYAAYNTFEPLHDAVMAGFSFLRGTPGESPFDPSDSIVIPLASIVAISVWRKAKTDAKSVRIRLGILVAAVAAVASLASSVVTTSGVTAIGATADGTIIASDLQGIAGISFASEDGGFTWDSVSGVAHIDITWGQSKVDTPRGKYEVVGASVEKTVEGRKSTALVPPIQELSKHSRAIRAATIDFGVKRRVTPVFDAILYDTQSGNVIVTNGIQGVVVETPDGEWRRVNVAGYKPIDFSPFGNLKRLNNHTYWLMGIAIGFAMSAALIAYTAMISRYGARVGYDRIIIWSTISITIFVPISMFITSDLSVMLMWQIVHLLLGWLFPSLPTTFDTANWWILATILLLGFYGGICYLFAGRNDADRRFAFGSFLCTVAIVHALLAIIIFNDEFGAFTIDDVIRDLPLSAPIIAIVLSIVAIKLVHPTITTTLAGLAAFLIVLGSIWFCLYLWMSGHLSIEIAKLCAVIIIATIAIVYGFWIHQGHWNEDQPPRVDH